MTNHTGPIIRSYDPKQTLARASTIPAAWYVDQGVFDREKTAVFGRSWLAVGRCDQVCKTGDYFTSNVAGEPIVVIRGSDGTLRAFFNVCRHHAAEVATESSGCASTLRCPYHGWTYDLDGSLKATPDFAGVEGFEKNDHGLVPIRVDTWSNFVWVCFDADAPGLPEFLGAIVERVAPLELSTLRFHVRTEYEIECNWKVFVDNYLDGGYHVPHIHKGLGSVLSYQNYTIENCERFCVQSTPVQSGGGDVETAAVRGGDMAYYYWLYPNFMLNWYEGYLDTNLAWPIGVNRTKVVFDFYFAENNDATQAHLRQSVAVAERVQQEDIDICESVQRGLGSRAYNTGRLAVRREGGEHLFHRLLYADLI